MNDGANAGRSHESLEPIGSQRDDLLFRIRHSAAHLMAEAIQQEFPEARFAIGPPVEDGFYYDVDLPHPLTPDDLEAIEARMREIQKRDAPFVRQIVSRDAALLTFATNPYKVEIISEIPAGETIATYRQGGFLDLCRGPHVTSTGQIGAFKLLWVAGAYWRGDERRPMLQRIYGTAWRSQAELDAHLDQLEEARKRDHRRLGRQLELFFLHPTAPGMPYWLPKGVTLLDQLLAFWREEHRASGYIEVATPMLNKKELFETSGHWSHYQHDMFTLEMDAEDVYGLKPMNCPNAMITFGITRRSYRDLPLRLADLSQLHRYERSGTLAGLFRVRNFRQDDAHIFVSPDQLLDEFRRILELVDRFYALFGLEYRFRLGTRPDDFLGDIETWNEAETILAKVLAESGLDFWIEAGDGAFYGPKIDILMRDSLRREWQMGTLQLDFHMPRQFGVVYAAEDGSMQTPVTIHRAILGSVERFVGILIEHFNGAFPPWLAPVQAVVIPVTDQQLEFAEDVASRLRASNVRVEVDASSTRMQAKIRASQLQKVPYMLVVGRREAVAGSVSVRLRTGEDLGA
ncbi:MAG TPA: threonine--tRNA ligase, partial [Thermomicrobiales bacterium]|nr:threonine--tRNA ligase [Thermomicrobiales bacterium]